MGDCASRPTEKQIQEHKREINTINDSYFVSIPYVDQNIENDKSQIILRSKQKFYMKKINDFRRGMEHQRETHICGLNVEIQKGLNFDRASSCLNRGKPLVTVKLEPKGPAFETFVGDPFKPYWYKLCQFTEPSFLYSDVSISVSLQKEYGKSVTIGSIKFSVKELKDQMLRDDWYKLEDKEISPAIKLRVQFIYDYQELSQNLIKICQQKLQEISDRLVERS